MNRLTSWRRQFDQHWQAAAPRERLIARLAALFVGLLLLWALALAPAWKTLRTAPAELDRLDAELQQMRALAGQVQQLRQTLPLNAEQALAAVRAAAQRLGTGADLTVQGNQVQLRLNHVAPADLVGLLTELRQAARARPVQAELQSGPQGYSGRLVLSLPQGT